MVDFEMSFKRHGFIKYVNISNNIIIKDSYGNLVEFDIDELIKFTNTNFWKYLSKQVTKE